METDDLAVANRFSLARRPAPPLACADDELEAFFPDADFADWIRRTFIDPDGPLWNEEHQHLEQATLGVVWTNAINRSKGRVVMGTAEIPQAMAGGWKRARHDVQIRDWFGHTPHFVLTFSGPLCRELDDRAFCALVEHELYHCAQDVDWYGAPKFTRDGMPVFTIKGHDVEQFLGVVERYGPTSANERRMVNAANRGPEIGDGPINIACGTCLARVA